MKKEGQTRGGAETTFADPRQANPADVALPPGYRVEVVSTGFTFPTGVAFDDANRPHVTESGYAYGERYAPGRLIRVEQSHPRVHGGAGNDAVLTSTFIQLPSTKLRPDYPAANPRKCLICNDC